jgi:hypothetical protein
MKQKAKVFADKGSVAQLGEQAKKKQSFFLANARSRMRRAGFQAEQDCAAQKGAHAE